MILIGSNTFVILMPYQHLSCMILEDLRGSLEQAIVRHSERHRYFLGYNDFILNCFLFSWNKASCLSAVSYTIFSTVSLDSVGGFLQVRQCWHSCPFNLTIL